MNKLLYVHDSAKHILHKREVLSFSAHLVKSFQVCRLFYFLENTSDYFIAMYEYIVICLYHFWYPSAYGLDELNFGNTIGFYLSCYCLYINHDDTFLLG